MRMALVTLCRSKPQCVTMNYDLPLPPVQEKNVDSDALAGKVGRIYMPPQKVDTIALNKMKGLKRERRQATGERKQANASGLAPKQSRREAVAAVEED